MHIKWNSKTTWTGLALAAYGFYLILHGQVQVGIQNIGAGLGFVFLRAGVEKNKQ